jgi:hypothetical protein
LDLYPTYHPAGGVQVLKEAWNLLSDDVKAILQSAESNLNALNTVDLGPKRPFSVGECALWARLTGPRFAAQVAAVVSLVEAPANHCKARGGSLSSEGANAAAEAERSTTIKLLRSLQHNNALVLYAITTLNLSSEFIFMVIYPHSTISKSSSVDRDLSRSRNSILK